MASTVSSATSALPPSSTSPAAAGAIAKPSGYFTFALYFSEKKSKQLCQFLDDFPFVCVDADGNPKPKAHAAAGGGDTCADSHAVCTDGSFSSFESGVVCPALSSITSQRIRGVKMVVGVVEGERGAVGAADPNVFYYSPSSSNDDDSSSGTTTSTTVSVRLLDNLGHTVGPAVVDVLLQKASADKDEGREATSIAAIQAFCDAYAIRIVDPLGPSLDICSSRSHIARRLAGGPYGGEGGALTGRACVEMLDYWGFLMPSTYIVRTGEGDGGADNTSGDTATASDGLAQQRPAAAAQRRHRTCAVVSECVFEEPNAHFKADVLVLKPEVASQRSYSHDLVLARTRDVVDAIAESQEDGDGDGDAATGAVRGNAVAALIRSAAFDEASATSNGDGSSPSLSSSPLCASYIAQDCVSLLALPMVYKVYVAGDYMSVALHDAARFNEEAVRRVSDGAGGDAPLLMKGGLKTLFTAVNTMTERRVYQAANPSLHAECVNYFVKGTRNYDDLWNTVQFLKRPDILGVNFFGLDVLVVKGIDGHTTDRRYIVDVNYLPSYKNEVPARLFPALLKAMMGVHH